MKPIYNISNKEFSLLYQSGGYGPNGYVILPPGKYIVTKAERHHTFGKIWVSIKQSGWNAPLGISLDDFYKFQN